MENEIDKILGNEKLSREERKGLATAIVTSALATIGGLFEMGADIKVDNDGRSITITGYDGLNKEYGESTQYMGSSEALMERCYQADVSINDEGGFDSTLGDVMDEIQRDNKRLKTRQCNLLKP